MNPSPLHSHTHAAFHLPLSPYLLPAKPRKLSSPNPIDTVRYKFLACLTHPAEMPLLVETITCYERSDVVVAADEDKQDIFGNVVDDDKEITDDDEKESATTPDEKEIADDDDEKEVDDENESVNCAEPNKDKA